MMTSTGDIAAKLQSCAPQAECAEVKPLRLDVVRASTICGDLADDWRSIHATNPQLVSPYFDLEFTQAVARVRDDIEVAVFSEDDQVVALLPFQRSAARRAVPVGGRLNDSHGILMRQSKSDMFDSRELIMRMMKEANLDSFGFHALSQLDEQLEGDEFEQLGSYHLDLSKGWDTYRKWVRKHSSTVKRQGQKTRALEREFGPIRFELDCDDADVLESLIELKRAKYQRTKTFDILSVDWASNLLREISTVQQPGFQGLLSAMWAGDRLVAVHFGMLTDKTLHYWFPVYDPEFSRYSPGTELLLQVARESSSRGVTKVDLGFGDDDYKFRFCNGQETVACGEFNFSPLAFRVAKQRYLIRQKLKKIPMKPFVKSVLRGVFPGFGQWNFK